MTVLVDYLTISLKAFTFDELIKIMHINKEDLQEIKTYFAFAGMEKCFYLPKGIKIHTGEYIILELSGQGCRLLESIFGCNINWLEFIGNFMSREGSNISRLDIAADDKDGLLSMQTMRRYVEERKYISKAKRVLLMTGAEESIIFGSSTSDRRLRIYNKALERKKEGHWIRCEMQLRNDAAMSFFMRLFECGDIGNTYSGMLLDYLRFVSKENLVDDKNQQRLQTVRWWTKFLGTTQKIKGFYIGGLEYNKKGLYNYLSKQCASSIKTYMSLNNGDLDALYELFSSSELNKEQQFLIKAEALKASMRQYYKHIKNDEPERLLLNALDEKKKDNLMREAPHLFE